MVAQNGKTALVVATSGDISAAVSKRLAAEGFAIALALPGAQSDATGCVSAIRTAGGRATAVEANIGDPEAMHTLFDEAEAIFAGVDVLVIDADIMQLSPLADADEASFKRHVAINGKGVLSGVREAARRLRAEGRIIAISASPGSLQRPSLSIHAATAAGVKALVRVLAAELEASGLTLSAIALCPRTLGVVDAPFETRKPPEDLGDTVAFLAQADRLAVNGRVLCVEGITVSPVRKQER